MVHSVNFDIRTIGWSMARPATPVTAAIQPWSATKANGETSVGERPTLDGRLAARPTRGDTAQPAAPQNQTDQPATTQPSGPFAAQRLAQESDQESDQESGLSQDSPLRAVAMAAYLKARDSHIQILRSIQTLDLRV